MYLSAVYKVLKGPRPDSLTARTRVSPLARVFIHFPVVDWPFCPFFQTLPARKSSVQRSSGSTGMRSTSTNRRNLFTFSTSTTSVGAALEQDSLSVFFISRRIGPAERGFLRICLHCEVTQSYKYLFGERYTFVADLEALKFARNLFWRWIFLVEHRSQCLFL